MENARLDDVTQTLQDEEERLGNELAEAKDQVARLEDDLKRVEVALEAEKKLVEAGCSRVGFSLRFKEALPSFEKAGGKLLQDRPDTISIDP